RAKQVRDDNNAIKKLGFESLVSYTALAAVAERFALVGPGRKKGGAVWRRGRRVLQERAVSLFARALGSRRSAGLACGAGGPAARRGKTGGTGAPPGKGEPRNRGRAKLKRRSCHLRPGCLGPGQKRPSPESPCAPPPFGKIPAKTTPPWKTASIRCANCWV